MSLLLALGCYSEDIPVLYKIPAGEHYSVPRLVQTLDSDRLTFYAKFDQTSQYEGTDDINKLYGFSDCNSTIHNNSARFGWRQGKEEGTVDIFTYTYCDSKKSWRPLTTVQINRKYRYEIQLLSGKYVYRCNGTTIEQPRCNDCTRGVYLLSQPYFGGDNPAPHNVLIEIKQ